MGHAVQESRFLLPSQGPGEEETALALQCASQSQSQKCQKSHAFHSQGGQPHLFPSSEARGSNVCWSQPSRAAGSLRKAAAGFAKGPLEMKDMLVNYEALQCPSPCKPSSSAAGPRDRTPVQTLAETLPKFQGVSLQC